MTGQQDDRLVVAVPNLAGMTDAKLENWAQILIDAMRSAGGTAASDPAGPADDGDDVIDGYDVIGGYDLPGVPDPDEVVRDDPFALSSRMERGEIDWDDLTPTQVKAVDAWHRVMRGLGIDAPPAPDPG